MSYTAKITNLRKTLFELMDQPNPDQQLISQVRREILILMFKDPDAGRSSQEATLRRNAIS